MTLSAAIAAGLPETDEGIEIAFEPIAEVINPPLSLCAVLNRASVGVCMCT